MSVERMAFGATKDGQAVEKFLLKSGQLEAEIITYGATLTALRVPDKNGQAVDVVLGYRSVAGYEENGGYVGATVGRYANRIAGASFTIDGVTYPLAANEGTKQLHGGPGGYAHQLFRGEQTGESQVTLSFHDGDGANGYPGNVEMSVTYTLTKDGLRLSYRAETDKPTFCNFTNHSYFNLNGGGTAMDHLLWIKADAFTPVDSQSIPVAQAMPVAGTAHFPFPGVGSARPVRLHGLSLANRYAPRGFFPYLHSSRAHPSFLRRQLSFPFREKAFPPYAGLRVPWFSAPCAGTTKTTGPAKGTGHPLRASARIIPEPPRGNTYRSGRHWRYRRNRKT